MWKWGRGALCVCIEGSGGCPQRSAYLQISLMKIIPLCYIDTLLYKDPSQDTTSHITMLLLGYTYTHYEILSGYVLLTVLC
jgi:hypothetical protein